MFKMVAFDLDGTLLKEDKTISLKSIEAINDLYDNGILVSICSGRPEVGIKKYFDLLKIKEENSFYVSINGARTSDYFYNVINENFLNLNDFKMILQLYKDQNITIYVYDELGLGYFEYDEYIDLEYRLNKMNIHKIKLEDLKEDYKIYKIMVASNKEIIDGLKFDLKLYEKYNILRSSDIYYEFLALNSDKYYGIKKIAEKYNIKNEEILTFGDAFNDYLMLKNTYGIAMENGYEEVKKIAKEVTKSNEDDGIYYILKKYFKFVR